MDHALPVGRCPAAARGGGAAVTEGAAKREVYQKKGVSNNALPIPGPEWARRLSCPAESFS